jgi:hypothetical protein
MKTHRKVRSAAFAAATLSLVSMQNAARADVCFTAFGGSIHHQFAGTIAAFRAIGTRNLAGVTFGTLSSCAGLTHWPLVGTEVANGRSIILGFRAMTVDVTGCGAVDNIVALNPRSLSGPLQLHNDRNNFSNSSTLVPAACVVPPLHGWAVAPLQQGEGDAGGNTEQ